MRASADRLRQDIETIAGCSSSGPGTNRLSFTPEYWAAVDYVADQMAALGYERKTTLHGNTRFRKREADWREPAVAVGSHLDAVPRGGTVRRGRRSRCRRGDRATTGRLRCSVRPAVRVDRVRRRGGRALRKRLAGSKALVGRLTHRELEQMTDASGTSYVEALGATGDRASMAPSDVLDSGNVASYFELHIEQSLVLGSPGRGRDRGGDRRDPPVQGHLLGRGQPRGGDADASAAGTRWRPRRGRSRRWRSWRPPRRPVSRSARSACS